MDKECKICKIIKNEEQFFTCGKYKDKIYRRGECIECHNDLRRGNNDEYYKQYNAQEEIKIKKLAYKRTEKYKIQQRKYENLRYKEDIIYRLKKSLRVRVKMALQAKKWLKNNTLYEYLGCSLIEFKKHIENQFTLGMTWETYGHGVDKWTLDHIIPLSSAKTSEEMYKLCHFNNLQPMWYIDNIKKSNKY